VSRVDPVTSARRPAKEQVGRLAALSGFTWMRPRKPSPRSSARWPRRPS